MRITEYPSSFAITDFELMKGRGGPYTVLMTLYKSSNGGFAFNIEEVQHSYDDNCCVIDFTANELKLLLKLVQTPMGDERMARGISRPDLVT